MRRHPPTLPVRAVPPRTTGTGSAGPPGSARARRRLLAGAGLTLASLLGVVAPASAGDDPVGTWPLLPPPEVTARFDAPASPWAPGHRGVDLLGRPGQAVSAALPGTVSFAGTIAGRGVVVVDHGATRTTYEPVAGTAAVGSTVSGGEEIGALQVGGSHCAPRSCLHWGWIADPDTYLDPLRLVGAGPVRLLPLGSGGAAGTVRPRPAGPAATSPVPWAPPLPRGAWVAWVPWAPWLGLVDRGAEGPRG